ncbi:MAG: hypothetical protein V1857_06560, partial [archaeon]
DQPIQCMHEISRCVSRRGVAAVTTPNPIWEIILLVAEKAGLKVPEGPHRFLFLPRLCHELVNVVSIHYCGSLVFFPVETPFDFFLERLKVVPVVKYLGFNQLAIIRRDDSLEVAWM